MQSDPLQQLKDVHLPHAPAWWPPAPGWWLLAILVILACAWLAWHWYKRQRYQAPFQSAQRLHKRLRVALNAGEISASDYLHGANGLLKRVFIYAKNDPSSTALSGQEWLAYLDTYTSGAPFTSGPGTLLSERRFAGELSSKDMAKLGSLQRAIDSVLLSASHRRTGLQNAHD